MSLTLASTRQDPAVLDGPPPNRIARSPDGRAVHLTRATGARLVLDAETLRAACPCAHCRRGRFDGVFPENFTSVTIEHIAAIGHYAVNIGFSDGHARGIFPWSYLANLVAAPAPDDSVTSASA